MLNAESSETALSAIVGRRSGNAALTRWHIGTTPSASVVNALVGAVQRGSLPRHVVASRTPRGARSSNSRHARPLHGRRNMRRALFRAGDIRAYYVFDLYHRAGVAASERSAKQDSDAARARDHDFDHRDRHFRRRVTAGVGLRRCRAMAVQKRGAVSGAVCQHRGLA